VDQQDQQGLRVSPGPQEALVPQGPQGTLVPQVYLVLVVPRVPVGPLARVVSVVLLEDQVLRDPWDHPDPQDQEV